MSFNKSTSVGRTSRCCDVDVLHHGFLCFATVSVVIVQSTILNFYIIAFFRGHAHQLATYFLFLGDLFVVCTFAASFVSAYRYIRLRRKLELDQRACKSTEKQVRKRIQERIYKNVAWLSPKYCGTLPFSFIAWLLYSSYLTAKIGLIFTSNIPAFLIHGDAEGTDALNTDDAIHGLGTNLLKVSVGLSALVFVIMLQAHHDHGDNNAHSGYVLGICHNIAVEVFDSATLLGLLIVPGKDLNYLKVWNFNMLIIVLSGLNLILPTLTLYSLSLSDVGRQMSKVTKLTVASQLLHLLAVNVPFLCVRIYLWAALNYELSLFVVKNLCYIFLLVHGLHAGLTGIMCRARRVNQERSAPEAAGDGDGISAIETALDPDAEPNLNESRSPVASGSKQCIPMMPMGDAKPEPATEAAKRRKARRETKGGEEIRSWDDTFASPSE